MSNVQKRKGGFSLAEVVIALSVIVIVSVTSLSIVLSSMAAKAAAVDKTEAQSFASNVWECFQASENDAEFLSYVSFSEGVALGDGQTDENGYKVYTYHSEKNTFTAQIKVKFPENERSDFSIDVTDKDGDSIVSFSYRKGDKV